MRGFADCPHLSRHKLGGSSLCLLFAKKTEKETARPLTMLNARERFYLAGPSGSHLHPDLCLPSIQIVAAILAIAGIVMMTYADGFHSHSVIGIALVVGSASMSALYKVRPCAGVCALRQDSGLSTAGPSTGSPGGCLCFKRSPCSLCELGTLRRPRRHTAALALALQTFLPVARCLQHLG